MSPIPRTGLIVSGRKDLFAEAMRRTGLLWLLESAPRRPQLLVVNYHRIGNRDTTLFDPEVFSIDQQGLSEQIGFLKKNYDLLHPGDAVDIVHGRVKPRGVSILLTFDDGYLDNLTLAVPVLKAHGASAAFFLVTGYLEAKEDPKAGVAREVKEEIGLDVVETSLIGNYIFERKNEIMLCYHVVAEGTIKLGHEIAEVPDPYQGGPQEFENVLDILEDGCAEMVRRLQAGTLLAP